MELQTVAQLLKNRPSCAHPDVDWSAKLERMKEELEKMKAQPKTNSKKKGLGKGKRTRHL
jgi:hypothetical protein